MHPWLIDQRFSSVEGLDDHVRVWAFIAAHTAKGDVKAVALDWQHLEAEHHLGGIEIILQTHVFAGYPRTINALKVVHDIGAGAALHEAPRENPAFWSERGEALCKQVYGTAYEKLRQRMHALHTDFDRWMIECGYGRVLSRDGVTLIERELCVIATLAGLNAPPQLVSHIRGAFNAGATVAQVKGILDHTRHTWGRAAQAQADAVWRGRDWGNAPSRS